MGNTSIQSVISSKVSRIMVLSMERWLGQVAFVTGASSGIGEEIARNLVKIGLKVVGVARREDKLEKLSTELKGEKGSFHAKQCDMSQESEIVEAFEWTHNNLGPVSILINNAGIVEQTQLISGDAAKWRRVFDVNVLGLCVATREAIKLMTENSITGHIVHINSVLGHIVFDIPGLNVYPASKHAVTALTETLRLELNRMQSKIKVTSISPGPVKTEITSSNAHAQLESLFDKITLLDVQDISDAVLYVLSTPEHVQVHELTIKPINEPH